MSSGGLAMTRDLFSLKDSRLSTQDSDTSGLREYAKTQTKTDPAAGMEDEECAMKSCGAYKVRLCSLWVIYIQF